MTTLCLDCGRRRPAHYWEERDDVFCVATGTPDCQTRTIARLREEIACIDRALGLREDQPPRRIERLIELREQAAKSVSWISTSERLPERRPEPRELVLFVASDCICAGWFVGDGSTAWADLERDHENHNFVHEADDVTHWMPMPEAPEPKIHEDTDTTGESGHERDDR